MKKLSYTELEVGKTYVVSGSSGAAGGDFLYNRDRVRIVSKVGDEYEVEVYVKLDGEYVWEEYKLPSAEIWHDGLRFTPVTLSK